MGVEETTTARHMPADGRDAVRQPHELPHVDEGGDVEGPLGRGHVHLVLAQVVLLRQTPGSVDEQT